MHKGKTFPKDAFKSHLLLQYDQYFNRVLLRSELTVIYEPDGNDAKSDTKKLIHFLKHKKLEDACKLLKFCELVLTLPGISSSIERNFSTQRFANIGYVD